MKGVIFSILAGLLSGTTLLCPILWSQLTV